MSLRASVLTDARHTVPRLRVQPAWQRRASQPGTSRNLRAAPLTCFFPSHPSVLSPRNSTRPRTVCCRLRYLGARKSLVADLLNLQSAPTSSRRGTRTILVVSAPLLVFAPTRIHPSADDQKLGIVSIATAAPRSFSSDFVIGLSFARVNYTSWSSFVLTGVLQSGPRPLPQQALRCKVPRQTGRSCSFRPTSS